MIARPGRPVRRIVEAMTAAMVHRGPDAGGFRAVQLPDGVEGGLGFRRLAILDLSPAGNQPMVHPVTGDVLVFNGEIYNYADLRKELAAAGASFRGTSDTEVLLEGLVRHGESWLERIQGMFALAFHRVADRRLLFARDPMGIKPLYLARIPGALLFASEIRALMASGEVPTDVDPAGIAGMLAYGSVQSPRTIWTHVRDFPAGCYEWIDERAVSDDPPVDRRRFWSFPPSPRPVEADSTSHVRDLLTGALQRHVRADVPVGVFLSAGIDSTILATIAASLTPKVTAFTVGFEKALGEDEVVIAAATAHALGMKHVSVVVETESVFESWRSWMASMDSPSIDGFNTSLVSGALAQEGVVVGLSGLGADELFGGYGTLRRVRRLQGLVKWPFVPGLLRLAKSTGVGALLDRRTSLEKLVDIAEGETDLTTVFMGTRRVVSNRWLRGFGLDPAALGLDARWLDRERDDCWPTLDGDAFNTLSRLESTHYMRDTLLRDTDANSMRHSLEVRVPFLDLPLVDYVSALPAAAKSGGQGKALLRRACADLLPPAVLERKKTGFTLPVGAWMVGPMRGWCDAAVESLAGAPGFDGRVVRKMWSEYLSEPKSMHWSRPLALVVLGQHIASIRR